MGFVNEVYVVAFIGIETKALTNLLLDYVFQTNVTSIPEDC